MFSTTLAVMDGFPRALAVLMTRFVRDETEDDHDLDSPLAKRSFIGWMLVLATGAVLIISRINNDTIEVEDVLTWNGRRVGISPVRTRAIDAVVTRLEWL